MRLAIVLYFLAGGMVTALMMIYKVSKAEIYRTIWGGHQRDHHSRVSTGRPRQAAAPRARIPRQVALQELGWRAGGGRRLPLPDDESRSRRARHRGRSQGEAPLVRPGRPPRVRAFVRRRAGPLGRGASM